MREEAAIASVPIRPAAEVMRLSSLGAFHQTRLSFLRVLLRRMEDEAWRIDRPLWDVDAAGVGRAVYRVRTPARTYSLIAFAHDLPDHLRSDRVIAEAWDATFALFDGEPTVADLDRLSGNVPFQEAGRIRESELTLSRANRSARAFGHTVERLAAGAQPDASLLDEVGYLMRTTAVYGSGKFGAADRAVYADRPEFAAPFQAEMLTVFLIRAFTVDIVEHLAKARAPGAARLDPALARRLGVGNSTGLGMAPFLINHPILIHCWMRAREEALARVRSLSVVDADACAAFASALADAVASAADWRTRHPLYAPRVAGLRDDLGRLADHLENGALDGAAPWDRLYRWAEAHLTAEGREAAVSLMIEPYGTLVDGLSACMSIDEAAAGALDGRMRLCDLRRIAREIYAFAGDIDFNGRGARARCWYVSAEKLEPRLGERFEEPIEPFEQPLAPARDAIAMLKAIEDRDASESVATFVLARPEHRAAVRRAQIAARFPFAEIRDNTIDADMTPLDLLRAKLSFFGATKFDPRSDRWLRISLYQGAPIPDLGPPPAAS